MGWSRGAERLALRDFLGLDRRARGADHAWLRRSRARLPLEVHARVFAWVRGRCAQGRARGAALEPPARYWRELPRAADPAGRGGCALTRGPWRPAPDPLRRRDHVQKPSLVHGAGDHLGLVMRQLIGAALLGLPDPDRGLLVLLILPPDAGPEPIPSTGC